MNDETVLGQVPHGARHALVPSDFPAGERGTIAYRRQLVRYFNRDEESARRYKAREFRLTGEHTVRQVFDRLRRALEREGLIDEYFSLDYGLRQGDGKIKLETPWNGVGFRAISVWPVTGTSEGVYVHVEFVGCRDDPRNVGERPRYSFALAKTWTWDNAFKITRRIVELLGA